MNAFNIYYFASCMDAVHVTYMTCCIPWEMIYPSAIIIIIIIVVVMFLFVVWSNKFKGFKIKLANPESRVLLAQNSNLQSAQPKAGTVGYSQIGARQAIATASE